DADADADAGADAESDADATTCGQPALVTCAEPQLEAVCALQTGAGDTGSCGVGHDMDGDGLSDEWETAGGIDFDCDGTVTDDEKVLTNFDPVLPDGVTSNPHPSAEANRKDVFLRYDYMEVTGSGATCASASDCESDQYCVGQCSIHANKACATAFDCGGQC